MTGSSFVHEKRGSMTPQRALRVFQARGGKCFCPANDGISEHYGCGRKLTIKDNWRVEHGIALENGGNDEDAGLYILCEWCWPEKDADDHGQASHGRKMAVKSVVPSAFKKSRWGNR